MSLPVLPTSLAVLAGLILAASAAEWPQTLAFPGAEGAGRFASGGRGGSVVHVV